MVTLFNDRWDNYHQQTLSNTLQLNQIPSSDRSNNIRRERMWKFGINHDLISGAYLIYNYLQNVEIIEKYIQHYIGLWDKRGSHSVLTGCVIVFEMPVTLSLFIKSSIYTCRTDMCQMLKHLHLKNSGPIELLRSYMKRIFKLLYSRNTLWLLWFE